MKNLAFCTFSALSPSQIGSSLLRFGLFLLFLAALPLFSLAFNNGDPNFEIVVSDSIGQPMVNQNISLRLVLTTGSLDGNAQYEEIHMAKTDAAGRAAIAIGYGQPTDPKYVFDDFAWGSGNNFMRVELISAGSGRMLLKTQMPNVPGLRKWLFKDEKINNVIAIILVVWLGIVVYLLLSGRKLRKLEKQIEEMRINRP